MMDMRPGWVMAKPSARHCDGAKTAEKIHMDVLTSTDTLLNPCPQQWVYHPLNLPGGLCKHPWWLYITQTWESLASFWCSVTSSEQLIWNHVLMSTKWKKESTILLKQLCYSTAQVLIICVLREIWKIQLNELSKGFINRPLPPPKARPSRHVMC